MTKIALIDDDNLVTELLEKLLKMDGYETVSTSDSRKAFDLIQRELPDIILMDLMMPQPDGFKLCRIIKKFDKTKDIPIVIITALDDSDSRPVAFGAGASEYLTKPFHPDELAKIIIKVLREKRLGLYNE